MVKRGVFLMNYKVLIWSSQRDLWESYCVKRAKCTDGRYLNGKDLFPTRTWPSSPPCPISSSRGTYHTAWGQKGMLVSREGKRPQSQTTGKAYCHLPQATSSQSMAAESTASGGGEMKQKERKRRKDQARPLPSWKKSLPHNSSQ